MVHPYDVHDFKYFFNSPWNIYLHAGYIAPLPGEGCVDALTIVSGWRFSSVKISFDASMVTISLIMCALFYTNPFASVNIGTVISSFFVGFTLRQISNIYARFTGELIY